MLDQHRAIYALLAVRDRTELPPSEQRTAREKTKAALERLWRTGEILLEKPKLAEVLPVTTAVKSVSAGAWLPTA